MQPMRVLCDFDGTITAVDCFDLLLEELADDSWREVENAWIRGEIGSRECLAAQIKLIRGGWSAIQQVLDEEVSLVEGFVDFARWCNAEQIPLLIVSDGLDRVINYLFAKAGVRADAIFSNRLVENSNGSLELDFPFGAVGCTGGVCKCEVYSRDQRRLSVVIGDGRSDFCWAKKADVIFAKSSLEFFCRAQGLPFHSFNNFTDVHCALRTMRGRGESPIVERQTPRKVETGSL